MNNYTILSQKLQDELNLYLNNLIKNLNVPNKKFIYSIISGIVKSNSCHLTKISRTFNEDIKFKKTVERISRNLKNFDNIDTVHNNYLNIFKNNLNNKRLFFIDESDISKSNGKSFEFLGDIQDGSLNHKWTKGYGLTEIVTLLNDEPIITQSQLWSTANPKFISKNKILYDLLEKNISFFNNRLDTYIFDRGFDSTDLMKYLIKKDVNFIIRLKSVRTITIKNKKYTIDEVINKYKGKYSFKTNGQKGEIRNKLSFVKVKLNGIKEDLTLIISYPENINFEIAYIITNRKINNAHDAKQVVRDYFSRWKIEEFFKFKKQQFKLEDIRVRSLNSLSVMNSLINYSITFINICKRKCNCLSKSIITIAKPIKNKVYLNYYRLIEGIKIIFNSVVYKIKDYIDNHIRNINYVLKHKYKNEQLTLFNYNNI